MRLMVNGEPMELPAGATLKDLFDRLGLRREMLVTEVNRQIIDRSNDTFALSEGDQVELIQFVGGG
jgi:sulfur carrier protein